VYVKVLLSAHFDVKQELLFPLLDACFTFGDFSVYLRVGENRKKSVGGPEGGLTSSLYNADSKKLQPQSVENVFEKIKLHRN
jgi:hypothetical protein